MGGMKGEGCHEVLIIPIDDAVGVFLHFLEGKHAANGGHAVDVGDIDCLLGGEVGKHMGSLTLVELFKDFLKPRQAIELAGLAELIEINLGISSK